MDEEDHVVSLVLFPDLSFFDEPDGPAEPEGPVLSPWAKTKIGTFQARLEAVLQRRGQRKHNSHVPISSSLLVLLANESFGFNGWSSQIVAYDCISELSDETSTRFSMKQSAVVRVTLQDGTAVEALGTGEATNFPNKHLCLTKSRGQAVLDGLRSAILQLGQPPGHT